MTREKSDARYPLHGLKVLDFSRVLAGPFAGRMLSDLGADVVKVEPPDGDVTRLWGRRIAGLPGYYHQQNAGKRNISMDLRAPGAVDLVTSLVAEADILIENYRPDVMPRLGLGYETLQAVNPGLIMLSISGFGQGGPESHRPAYAPIIHAEAGLMQRQTNRGGIALTDLPLSVADTNASLHGLVGLLSAVIMRQRTGKGQHIDIAMIDATFATDDQVHYAMEDAEDTAALPNDVWPTGAGPILLSADCAAPNGARMALIADGQWREDALGFDRVLLLFDGTQRDAAAELWRRFAQDEQIDNRINKQDENGAWREGR